MSCCGEKRTQAYSTGHTQQVSESTGRSASPSGGEAVSPVYFQYVGGRTLTVIGRCTGRRYHFDSPGAVVAVDVEDKQALAHVPTLRQVKDVA